MEEWKKILTSSRKVAAILEKKLNARAELISCESDEKRYCMIFKLYDCYGNYKYKVHTIIEKEIEESGK